MTDVLEQENRALRKLIASSVVSKAADYGLSLVAPLAVLKTTGSPATAIFVISLRGVAYVASPLLGSLIDRFERRLVFALSQFLQAACVAVVAAALDSEHVVALMLLISGLGGVASSITGQFVLIPELVAAERRPHAVARLTAAIEFAKVGGFLLGGVTVGAFGAVRSWLLIVALYALAGAIALTLARVRVASTAPTSLRQDLALGFSWLAKPDIGWLVLSMSVANLAVGGLGTVLVTVLAEHGSSPTVISVSLAVGLLAGAVGARVAPWVLAARSLEVKILVFQAISAVALAAIATELGSAVLIGGFALMSLALGLSNVASISFRQDVIPVAVAGRVNSVIRMFIAGAIPLSGFLYAGAEAADLWLWLPAVVLATVSLLIWITYMVRFHSRQGEAYAR
ncbi:MFS transporter [Jatrophihabitans sp.]|uniref:MFS transporter n=1 Tax=Jatrophihabitans sp. TaxID=1932789 RepID=UPI002BAD32B7|nr:MFS transporter [Jatrophihabitans sp.]